jgi:acyl transferase domain-containing protein/SAM-dependent methyltransferase
MSERGPPAAELSPVKQALLEIRRLRARLAERRWFEPEPVAIVGMAVRFPGGIVSLDDFWNLLAAGESAITATPTDRWDNSTFYHADADQPGKTYSRHGGFLTDIDRFDAEFFGITPREAESMDPQHRILLELTWESLEHAGISATGLSGTNAGVFIGLSNSDYGRLLLETREDIDAYSSFGLASSIAAGRISYFLDARGPNLVVDTSCSSSLMAVHLGCRSLVLGESSLAIVGAANLILTPDVTISFSHARMLARDGQCRTFDAEANGYVRGEGCAVVVLKRLRDAQADGDRVLAVISGTAANHDGRSAGLTAPNGPAQQAVIRAALQEAKVRSGDVDYVEAHGTGTPLGDPIELQALGAVYGERRLSDRPLLVGSVKTNIGHLEAAAGLAGLVKVVLSLQHEALPAHRNFTTPNPHISWDNLPISVVRTLRGWPRSERPRYAGLSAFGFSGTNVHIVLKEAPPVADHTVGLLPHQECLFAISARSPEALCELVGRYVAWLNQSQSLLSDICHSAAVGRAHHRHRLAVIVRDRIELAAELRAWLADGQAGRVRVAVAEQPAPQVGYFYPALTAADAKANTLALTAASAAFAAAADCLSAAVSCESLTGPEADFDLTQAFALQHGLGHFCASLGITPSAVFGVGVGEIAAATLAGLLSPRDAVARARATSASPPTPAPGACTFVSTRTGRSETVWAEQFGESREPDRLAEAAHAVAATGVGLLLILGHDAPAAATFERQTAMLGTSADAAWSGLIAAVQTLYLAGVDLDWNAFYWPEQNRDRWYRLELPTYPFQRQRFWRPGARPTSGQIPAQAAVDWPKLISTVTAQSETGPLGWDPTTYATRWRRFDELAAGHAINTLVALGEFASNGARASADDLVRRHEFVPIYRNLVGRWLNLLVREGVLREEDGAFISPLPLLQRDLSEVWSDVQKLLSDDSDTLTYVKRASGKLLELLTGQVSPLEVLFERGSLDRAEGIYERSPSARYMNAIAAAAVRSAWEDHRGLGQFRLLEAGAGTGGTTSRLAEFFPSEGEYWFTDLSDAFLARARRRFGRNPAFRFTKFNLDLPLSEELPAGQMNVVLAANVVHATRDVGATLDRLRALLKPGGLLVLIESTAHHSHFDLTTAFLEGWSNFSDAYRSQHPLLSADGWIALLCQQGFVEAERFPRSGATGDNIGQHVVIARNSLGPQSDRVVQMVPSLSTGPTAVPDPVPAEIPTLRFVGPIDAGNREALERFVKCCAASVMHLDPARGPGPRERFSDLGMDSLMALQLQTVLGDGLGLRQRLPATIAFDTGTVEAMAEEILKLFAPPIGTDGPDAAASPTAATNMRSPGLLTADDLEAISDDEVEALLAQRILAKQGVVDQ